MNAFPVRDRRAVPRRPAENTRPPRYRLLAASAALTQNHRATASETFDRECPACGCEVAFTQTVTPDGIDYSIEDHLCRDA